MTCIELRLGSIATFTRRPSRLPVAETLFVHTNQLQDPPQLFEQAVADTGLIRKVIPNF
jgi:hypothetical protein